MRLNAMAGMPIDRFLATLLMQSRVGGSLTRKYSFLFLSGRQEPKNTGDVDA
jgi:hypothetical protein